MSAPLRLAPIAPGSPLLASPLLASLLLASLLGACSHPTPAEHPAQPGPAASPAPPAQPSDGAQPPAQAPASDDAEAVKIDREARIKITTSVAGGLRVGASIWMASHPGQCPSAEDIVNAKLVSPRLTVDDAWGRRFKIVCTEDSVGVRSWGPDGKEGTADDIAAGP